jgi:hypothetical protein
MNYKPDEKDLMAYLYDELEGQEREKVEQYLLENAEARETLEKFHKLRRMMSTVTDKEVIAPPIVIGESGRRFFWNTPYFNTIMSIAASLLLIILVGKLTGTQISFANRELRMSFGGASIENTPVETKASNPSLTAEQVQTMINSSLTQNNTAMQASIRESQEKLDASIRKNLALNSGKIDRLVREAAMASQEQINQYVANIQANNTQMVKDYFQLTAADQKKYVEDLLVDFSKYLQQQRNDDLQLVQNKMQSLEQNTNIFQQETEQILSSIISTVGTTPGTSTEIKN